MNKISWYTIKTEAKLEILKYLTEIKNENEVESFNDADDVWISDNNAWIFNLQFVMYAIVLLQSIVMTKLKLYVIQFIIISCKNNIISCWLKYIKYESQKST